MSFSEDGADRCAERLKSVLGPGQRAIGVAANCRHCNAVGLLIVEVPEPITMGEATCHQCDRPLLAVFGLGNRDVIIGAVVKLAMVNAAVVLGTDDNTAVGVSVGIRSGGFERPAPGAIRH